MAGEVREDVLWCPQCRENGIFRLRPSVKLQPSDFPTIHSTEFFYQLPVAEQHQTRMPVVSPQGLDLSNVAFMGFENSPAYAQEFMEQQLKPHFNDIGIFSDLKEQHQRHQKGIQDVRGSKTRTVTHKAIFGVRFGPSPPTGSTIEAFHRSSSSAF
ncbi:hypothetical protein F4781DRAFT_406487 [Annulohypoxylon bovei var. microspora]|nr:hypothetical protein F4781DRAFT_406487 [Annulohypoxylon bovei var. microspora]